MANFNVHFVGSVLGSGLLATVCYNTQTVTAEQMGILWTTGCLAGLLPDMDSGHSTSLKVVFNTISLIVSIMIVVFTAERYPLLWTAAIILFAYLFLRWIILPIFKEFTVHRGNWHTLLAGLCTSIFMTNISWHFNHVSATYAWLLGLFTCTGFFIHLLLDELYAFDIKTLRFKRSFGSAIKPFRIKTPVITMMVAGATAWQCHYLPPWSIMTNIVRHLGQVRLI